MELTLRTTSRAVVQVAAGLVSGAAIWSVAWFGWLAISAAFETASLMLLLFGPFFFLGTLATALWLRVPPLRVYAVAMPFGGIVPFVYTVATIMEISHGIHQNA
ncbi:hypothetical protein [Nocardia sp. NPDC057440]|uniref:hypothetical protein n=1 Tax=Nocardia sp. NPDC057440 TaxID=3346134 RepID=UPI00366ACA1B